MTTKPIRLIQLVSEQTMQNVLPILRLDPVHLVHLVTPMTASRSAWIVEAARQAGFKPTLDVLRLSAMPSMAEMANSVRGAVLDAQEAGQTPVVNFTGGTKLMSIGAFYAALNPKHSAISLYVDSHGNCFVDGATSPGLAERLENDFSFTPLARMLTVNTIAVANGRDRVTGGRDWTPFLPLARHLMNDFRDQQLTLDVLYGANGLTPYGKTKLGAGKWLALLDRHIPLPPCVAGLGVEAGVLRSVDGQAMLPDSTRADLERLANSHHSQHEMHKASRPLQTALSFLTGSWWEVIVAEAAARSGIFRDIRWSSDAGTKGGAENEEDILAVEGVELVCISCKRGGNGSKLVGELEQLNTRARSLGGNFSRRLLAVFLDLKGPASKHVPQRARELGIGILGPTDLTKPNVFVRRGLPG